MARERGCSVADLKERTELVEFVEWCAFQSLNPSSEWRADYRAAMIVATIRNLFNKGRAITPQDILDQQMNFDPQPFKPKSDADIEREIMGWARGLQRQQERKRRRNRG